MFLNRERKNMFHLESAKLKKNVEFLSDFLFRS